VTEILSPHGRRFLLHLSLVVFGELELGHRVEQFGQVSHHLLGLVTVRQNIEQVSARHEIKSLKSKKKKRNSFLNNFKS